MIGKVAKKLGLSSFIVTRFLKNPTLLGFHSLRNCRYFAADFCHKFLNEF